MDDVGGVDRLESEGDLPRDVATQRLREPLQLAERVAERLALDVLHHEEVLRPLGQLRDVES